MWNLIATCSRILQHFVAYPIATGKWANVGGFVTKPDAWGTPWNGPWASECDNQELLDHFSGWEPDVVNVVKVRYQRHTDFLTSVTFVKRIDKPLKWAVHEVRPLPFYVQGSVALLGDAVHCGPLCSGFNLTSLCMFVQAHAMTIHQGSGAGQAIEVSACLFLCDVQFHNLCLLGRIYSFWTPQ